MDSMILNQWIAVEHSRLQNVEAWPDSVRKQAVLAGIRSSIESLIKGHGATYGECSVCRARHVVAPVNLCSQRVQVTGGFARVAA
jgi:hypothetical protein